MYPLVIADSDWTVAEAVDAQIKALGKITLELPEDIDDMLEKKAAREAEKALLDKERKRAYNKKKK